jgi:glucose/arabinose dehydrogenase
MKPIAILATLALLAVSNSHTAGAFPGGGDIGAEPVATGLEFPAAFTFAPDGRIFYGETFTGEVRVFDPVGGSDTLFYSLGGDPPAGTQLLGLALAPGYPANAFVFGYVARWVDGERVNQIVRLRDTGGVGSQPRVIYESPATTEASGGRILFGADRMLYAMVGDDGDPANSQDLGNTHGKILRMTPSGRVPRGNPFPDSLIWAYGLRNSIGFDFDQQTGSLWEEDNGPQCNDEINLIRAGQNYGWGPSYTCDTPPAPPLNTNQDGPDPVLPVRFTVDTVAPTGLRFCSGCGLDGADGKIFYGTYNTFAIRNATLTADREGIVSIVTAYSHASFVLGVERGPDGALYFSDQSAIYRLVQN